MQNHALVIHAGGQAPVPDTDTLHPPLAATRNEAAAMLRISASSLDKLVARGLLKPSRALRRPLFPIEELRRFLNDTRGAID